MAVSESEALEAPGANVPFSLDPILVKLEGGRFVGTILPMHIADLVSIGGRGGLRSSGSGRENGSKLSGRGGGSASASTTEKTKN